MIGFLIFLICSNLFGFSFKTSEKLIYSAGFRFLSAGEASIELTIDTLLNDTVFKIQANTKTNPFFDRFYKIRDKVTTWVDPLNYELLKVDKNLLQGKYRRKHNAIINHQDSTIITSETIKKIQFPVFDPISVIYLLRLKIREIKQLGELHIYDLGKSRKVLFNITGKETIEVPYGVFSCFIVEPISNDNKALLKNKGQMKIWYSDENFSLPVRIEQVTNIGVMIMELQKVIKS